MGKKRKANASTGAESNGPNMDVGDSRKQLRTFEDVADSDDEFHLNRDKVLLEEGPEAKRRRKWEEEEEFLQPQEEEVLDVSDGYDDDDDDDGDDEEQPADDVLSETEEEAEDESDDQEEGWGTSKADLYGADAIETEQQALEEEAEARRLQQRQLQSMSAADYGFDEDDWQDTPAVMKASGKRSIVTEVLPQLEVSDSLSPAERLKLLKSRYPEFEPLSQELLGVKESHNELSEDVSNAVNLPQMPNLITKWRASSAYLAALCVYFALMTSTAPRDGTRAVALSANLLRDHGVMEKLVECKSQWQRAQTMPKDQTNLLESSLDSTSGPTPKENIHDASVLGFGTKKSRKSRKQRHAEAIKATDTARKAVRLKRTEADFGDLDALVAPLASQLSNSKPVNGGVTRHDDSDIGEEAALTTSQVEEKEKRKKSLRFYTSQIAQKANKRGAAGRNAGGDDDIPHRERLKDRQARLNAEAEKRGKTRPDIGDDLGGDSDAEDDNQARQIRKQVDDDDYYDMVAARTAKKKSDKAAFVKAQQQAAEQGGRVIEQETLGADGKRKITYAIEKNKGLTPHRKKDVRNPRVKKRKKFEEKSKKLASMKPTYRGGEGRGGYAGELTGIKTNLIKSTKL